MGRGDIESHVDLRQILRGEYNVTDGMIIVFIVLPGNLRIYYGQRKDLTSHIIIDM